jgi:hypothetical protein
MESSERKFPVNRCRDLSDGAKKLRNRERSVNKKNVYFVCCAAGGFFSSKEAVASFVLLAKTLNYCLVLRSDRR